MLQSSFLKLWLLFILTLAVVACDASKSSIQVNTTKGQAALVVPEPEISSQLDQITNQKLIPVTIKFSKPVASFDVGDIRVKNATIEEFSGSGADYAAVVAPIEDGIVTIEVPAGIAKDVSRNTNTASKVWSIEYDTRPPSVVSIVLNSGASYTNSSSVSLSLSAPDASEMYITNASGCSTGGDWEAIQAVKSWTLGQINASSSVFVKFKDLAGNESSCQSDSIIHDSTPPVTPTIAEGSKSFDAMFDTSLQQGIPSDVNFKEFRYSIDGSTPTCSTGLVANILPASVSIPAVTTTLKVIACDYAGLSSGVATSTYSYDSIPPFAPTVTGTTPTANTRPTWSWSTGGNGGNGTFRYKLNSSDLSTGATETTSTSFTPATAQAEGTYTLYVQERDAARNWSTSGSLAIQIVTPPTAPTLSTPTRLLNSLSLSWAPVSGATSYNLYWSTTSGVTTESTKLSSVTSPYSHTSLNGSTTYFYKVEGVKSGVAGPLSNEVSASPYSVPAPTVTGISPTSGTTEGGTSVTLTGTGFISGLSVSIGGAGATAVSLVSATSLTATTPAGSAGAQNIVVTNPDGQTGTLTSGYTYMVASCANDCYLEGSGPNYAQNLAIGTERVGPSGITMSLQYAIGSSGFKVWKEKNGTKILNASGLVANGWQMKLNRAGTAYDDYLTDSNGIGGRACPTNVFISHTNMTATQRCVYYDAGNAPQNLNANNNLTEGKDWLSLSTAAATGRGSSSSYYEGNIKICADKGMRLPVSYETTLTAAPSSLPNGDTGVTPQWAGANGVPSATGDRTWTATSVSWSDSYYHVWSGTSANNAMYNSYYNNGIYFAISVRCVLPGSTGDLYELDPAGTLVAGGNIAGPDGTILELATASGSYKVWREKNGTRILNASGRVSGGWQKQLTRAGTAFTVTDFTTLSNIAGRVCPINVFIDFTHMTETNRCLYYDGASAAQRLDAACPSNNCTSPLVAGEAQDWLQDNWNAATGRGGSTSYYEGNIKTCSDKGMRLPVAYETTMNKPTQVLPTGDSINPTWPGVNYGVPSSGNSWTASANNGGYDRYWRWNGTTSYEPDYNPYSSSHTVRCVLPNN